MFVATEYVFCRDKHVFVATKHVFCRDKTFVSVATKMVLVAAPANDSCQANVLSSLCFSFKCPPKLKELGQDERNK